tara:strand:+ start:5581 stop:6702 length:1122 start_codon:yes stop_codon:yes gene_type:complete
MIFLLIASFPDSVIKFRGPLIDALLRAGKEVHVAMPGVEPQGGVALALARKGVHLHSVPLQRTGLNPITDLRLLAALVSLMWRIRPQYVLSYTIKPVIYGSLAAWLTGVKHRFALVTGLGYAFTDAASGKRALLRRLIQSLYRFALKCTHRVFFQNPDDEALFRDLKLLSETVPSSVVNGSGVDIAEYVAFAPPDKPCFLLIARLLGDKGVREYAQAAQSVKAVHPEAVFRLVGWIDDNPDAIAQRELDHWVHSGLLEFMGKVDDVRPMISECTVYVLPSYREGTPRTVLEAMAMGRAVITTDAPGCRETVVDGDNGFLVPVKNVDALASAMIKAIESPDLVKRMGQRSRLVAETKYDVHKVNAAMLEGMGIQ